MLKSASQFTALSVAIWLTGISFAWGQTRSLDYPVVPPEKENSLVCFMKTASGQLVDLDVFCASEPQEPTLGTGDVQTTIRWSTADDLDLWVTDPSGQTAYYQNRRIASGGTLDVDANADCREQRPSPVENIFWPTGGAPMGDYVAEVKLFRRCTTSTAPIPFRFRLLVKGEEKTLEGVVSEAEPVVKFPFAVSSASSSPGSQPSTTPASTSP